MSRQTRIPSRKREVIEIEIQDRPVARSDGRERDTILVRERDLNKYYPQVYQAVENDQSGRSTGHAPYMMGNYCETMNQPWMGPRMGHFPGPIPPLLQVPQQRFMPRVPHYNYNPPFRPLAPRGFRPRYDPYYRNQPRRRHHLDDIFLPNHDDDEFGNGQGNMQSHYPYPRETRFNRFSSSVSKPSETREAFHNEKFGERKQEDLKSNTNEEKPNTNTNDKNSAKHKGIMTNNSLNNTEDSKRLTPNDRTNGEACSSDSRPSEPALNELNKGKTSNMNNKNCTTREVLTTKESNDKPSDTTKNDRLAKAESVKNTSHDKPSDTTKNDRLAKAQSVKNTSKDKPSDTTRNDRLAKAQSVKNTSNDKPSDTTRNDRLAKAESVKNTSNDKPSDTTRNDRLAKAESVKNTSNDKPSDTTKNDRLAKAESVKNTSNDKPSDTTKNDRLAKAESVKNTSKDKPSGTTKNDRLAKAESGKNTSNDKPLDTTKNDRLAKAGSVKNTSNDKPLDTTKNDRLAKAESVKNTSKSENQRSIADQKDTPKTGKLSQVSTKTTNCNPRKYKKCVSSLNNPGTSSLTSKNLNRTSKVLNVTDKTKDTTDTPNTSSDTGKDLISNGPSSEPKTCEASEGSSRQHNKLQKQQNNVKSTTINIKENTNKETQKTLENEVKQSKIHEIESISEHFLTENLDTSIEVNSKNSPNDEDDDIVRELKELLKVPNPATTSQKETNSRKREFEDPELKYEGLSPQSVKKTIKMKLITIPLSRCSVNTTKYVGETCGTNIQDFKLNQTKSIYVNVKENATSLITKKTGAQRTKEPDCGGPVLEEIFILEDALNDIDREPEEIHSPPSSQIITNPDKIPECVPSKKHQNKDVQIVEPDNTVIEIDDNSTEASTDQEVARANRKSPVSAEVIDLDSPEEEEEGRLSPTNIEVANALGGDDKFEVFSNLDTHMSYLETFKKYFDDNRVVDMDISYTPPPSRGHVESTDLQQIEAEDVSTSISTVWNDSNVNENCNAAQEVYHSIAVGCRYRSKSFCSLSTSNRDRISMRRSKSLNDVLFVTKITSSRQISKSIKFLHEIQSDKSDEGPKVKDVEQPNTLNLHDSADKDQCHSVIVDYKTEIKTKYLTKDDAHGSTDTVIVTNIESSDVDSDATIDASEVNKNHTRTKKRKRSDPSDNKTPKKPALLTNEQEQHSKQVKKRKRRASKSQGSEQKERKKKAGKERNQSTQLSKPKSSNVSQIQMKSTSKEKYVTKAEYIKKFSRIKSPVNVSLSIQTSVNTKQGPATFTREDDQETILKKHDKKSGRERCASLFGSSSEGEEESIPKSKEHTKSPSDKTIQPKNREESSRQSFSVSTAKDTASKQKHNKVDSRRSSHASEKTATTSTASTSTASTSTASTSDKSNDPNLKKRKSKESATFTHRHLQKEDSVTSRALNDGGSTNNPPKKKNYKKPRHDEVISKQLSKKCNSSKCSASSRETVETNLVVESKTHNRRHSTSSNDSSNSRKSFKKSKNKKELPISTAPKNACSNRKRSSCDERNSSITTEMKKCDNGKKEYIEKRQKLVQPLVNTKKEDKINKTEDILKLKRKSEEMKRPPLKKSKSTSTCKNQVKKEVTNKDNSNRSVQDVKIVSRRKSTPEVLNNSPETSRINDEHHFFPLIHRANEEVINTIFENCSSLSVTKPCSRKITVVKKVKNRCEGTVHINHSVEVKNDSTVIRQKLTSIDEDVIEITSPIPMIDLTEDDNRERHAASPKESLADLLLETKKGILEIAEKSDLVTLYRSDEGASNSEDVQAMSASFSLNLSTDRVTDLKEEASVSSDIPSEKAISLTDANCSVQTPEEPHIRSLDEQQTGLNLPAEHVTVNHISKSKTTGKDSSKEVNSIDIENQNAVSALLELLENPQDEPSLEVPPTNSSIANLVDQILNSSVSSDEEKSRQTNVLNASASQHTAIDNPTNSANPNSSQVVDNYSHNQSRNRSMPIIISDVVINQVNEERVQAGGVSDNNELQKLSNLVVERNMHQSSITLSNVTPAHTLANSNGLHNGLSQTFLKHGTRPNDGPAPPSLITINPGSNTQNIQNRIQNSSNMPQIISVHTVANINLISNNFELSRTDLKRIVEIFTRHTYFFAHLCHAQKTYVASLSQVPFYKYYIKTEIALFNKQKQQRLISESIQLYKELQALNIRASGNLSNAVSLIVDNITISLTNKTLPVRPTKSIVYLLIAELIKPQQEYFTTIPLFKTLIRHICIVTKRIQSRSSGPFTEEMRRTLEGQVREYARLCNTSPTSYQQQPTMQSGIQPNSQATTLNANNQNLNATFSNSQSGISRESNKGSQHLNNINSRVSATQADNRAAKLSSTTSEIIAETVALRSNINSHVTHSGSPRYGNTASDVRFQFQQHIVTTNSMTLPRHSLPISHQPALRMSMPAIFRSVAHSGAPQQLPVDQPEITFARPRLPAPVASHTTQNHFVRPTNQITFARPRLPAPVASHTTQNQFVRPNTHITFARPRLPAPVASHTTQNQFVRPNTHMTFACPSLPAPVASHTTQNQFMRPNTQIADLPGGANTRTLGCTPRYFTSYDGPSERQIYASVPRPIQILSDIRYQPSRNQESRPISQYHQSVEVTEVPANVRPMATCNYTNTQDNIAKDVRYLPNSLPTGPPPRYEDVTGSTVNSISTPPNSSEDSRNRNASLLKELLATSERPPLFGMPATRVNDNSTSPNPSDDSRNRNATLLKELLATSEKPPLFGMPATTVNDNFKIKLPFTKPNRSSITTMTTTSPQLQSCSNSEERASIMQNQSTVLETPSSNPQNSLRNVRIMSSGTNKLKNPNSQHVAVVQSTSYQSQNQNFLEDNTTKTNAILNQGLAALSSIGQPSVMVQSSTNLEQSQLNQQISSNTTGHILLEYQVTLGKPTETTNSLNALEVLSKKYPEEQSQGVLSFENSEENVRSSQSRLRQTEETPKPKIKIVSGGKRGHPTKIQKTQRNNNKSMIIEVVDITGDDEISSPSEDVHFNPHESSATNNAENTSYRIHIDQFAVNARPQDLLQLNREYPGTSLGTASSNQTLDVSSHGIDSTEQIVDKQELNGQCQSENNSSVLISTPSQIHNDLLHLSQTNNKDNIILQAFSAACQPAPTAMSNISETCGSVEDDEIETIDLTWIDDMDETELKDEIDFVFVKQESLGSDSTEEGDNREVPSPADSGISNSPNQNEEGATYTVVKSLCICGQIANYNCVCEDAWYCGTQCQYDDWESHQRICHVPQEEVDGAEQLVLNQVDDVQPDQT